MRESGWVSRFWTLLWILQSIAAFALSIFLSPGAIAMTVTRAAGPPAGTVEILSSQTQRTSNFQNCAGASCGAVEFAIQTDTYGVYLPAEDTAGKPVPGATEISYGTRSYISYQTRDLAHLEDYGLAQFVRGCQYTSKIQNGVVQKIRDISYDLDGKNVDYHFPQFVIDGFVKDPIDWGDDPQAPSRHAYYKWNEIPGSFDSKTEHWEGQAPAQNPSLYVTDHPGSAFFSGQTQSARNISIEFRTCLYKTADVPRDVDPTNLNFARPLACFDWASGFVYDFATKTMTQLSALDPFCQ